MKTALFVPAKGTSERIPGKNLSVLDGEYLFKRKLLQVLACNEVHEVWLDSENNNVKFINCSKGFKFDFMEKKSP